MGGGSEDLGVEMSGEKAHAGPGGPQAESQGQVLLAFQTLSYIRRWGWGGRPMVWALPVRSGQRGDQSCIHVQDSAAPPACPSLLALGGNTGSDSAHQLTEAGEDGAWY